MHWVDFGAGLNVDNALQEDNFSHTLAPQFAEFFFCSNFIFQPLSAVQYHSDTAVFDMVDVDIHI